MKKGLLSALVAVSMLGVSAASFAQKLWYQGENSSKVVLLILGALPQISEGDALKLALIVKAKSPSDALEKINQSVLEDKPGVNAPTITATSELGSYLVKFKGEKPRPRPTVIVKVACTVLDQSADEFICQAQEEKIPIPSCVLELILYDDKGQVFSCPFFLSVAIIAAL